MIFDEVGIFPLHGYIPWFCTWLCSPQACNNNNNNNNNNNGFLPCLVAGARICCKLYGIMSSGKHWDLVVNTCVFTMRCMKLEVHLKCNLHYLLI